MPVYQCNVPFGLVDEGRRAQLAEAIATVHSEVTRAPKGFVHVIFHTYQPSEFFTAGKPNKLSVINGAIRAGRSREERAELLTRLSAAWTAITGEHVRNVAIGLNELDPTSVMEAGLILPAPGEEASWQEKNKEVLGELLSSK